MVAGQADPRRPGRHLRRGRHPVGSAEQPVRARLEHQRRQLQHRRRDRELAGRRRRRDDDVLRPGHVRGGQLHDLGDPGRNAGRRRVHQHGDQGRRQHVAGQRPLQVLERRLQSENWADTQAVDPTFLGNPTKKTYDFNLSGGGAIMQEPAVGERHCPQVGGEQAGQRHEPRRLAGARRQRPEELLGQGRRPALAEQQGPVVVPLEQQDPRPSPRQPTNNIADIASLVQTNPVQTTQGEVHRDPAAAWCSSPISA